MNPAPSPALTDSKFQPLPDAAPGAPGDAATEELGVDIQETLEIPLQEDVEDTQRRRAPQDAGSKHLRGLPSSTGIINSTPFGPQQPGHNPQEPLHPPINMESINSPQRTPFSDDATAKYKTVAKLQDKFLAGQTSLKSERDAAASMLGRLLGAQSEMARLLETGDKKRRSFPLKPLKSIIAQILNEGHAFQAQMQRVNDMEQSLGKLEYRLAKLHPELLDILHKHFKFDPGVAAPNLSRRSSESQRTSSSLTPLEEQYYDKRGDVRRLRDQLIDHQADLQTPSDESNIDPIATEHESSALYSRGPTFRAKWQLDHDNMQQELYQAEQELTQLWRTCQDAGLHVGSLSVELFDPVDVLGHETEDMVQEDVEVALAAPPFWQHSRGALLPDVLRNLPWPSRGAIQAPLLGELTKFAEKRTDIEKWVAKLPTGQAPQTGFGTEYSVLVEPGRPASVSRSDGDWAVVHPPLVEELDQYVFIPEMQSETAQNGEPLVREPGILHRVLRKWRSLDDMWSKSEQDPRLQHRASEDIRRGWVVPNG